MKCVIDGAYGFNNVGDEAMLNIASKVLSGMSSDIEVIVSSYLPERIMELHGLKSTSELLPATLVRNLVGLRIKKIYKQIVFFNSISYMVFSGGSILNDSKGLRNLIVIFYKLMLSQLFNFKVVFWGVSVGPVKSRRGRFMVKWILKKSELVILRDENSYVLAKKISQKNDNITQGVDILFSANSTGFKCDSIRVPAHADYIRIGLSLRPYPPIVGVNTTELDELMLQQMSTLWGKIYQGKNVIIVPLVFSEGERHKNDMGLLKQVSSQSKNARFEFTRLNISEVRNAEYSEFLNDFFEMYASLDMVIGERFHSLVIAQLLEVPYVALSYDAKIDELAKLAEVEECVIDLVSALNNGNLNEMIASVINSTEFDIAARKKINSSILNAAKNDRDLIKQVFAR